MIDIDVEYERNKRPLTAMQKKKQQQYREKRNRVCALSKKHGKAYLAGDADDFYIRYNKKKASCAKKTLNKFGREALSTGFYLVNRKIKTEANELARNGKVVDLQGSKVDKVCEYSGAYSRGEKPMKSKCKRVTGVIRWSNRSSPANVKDRLLKKEIKYEGQGKGSCVLSENNVWLCKGNVTGQLNSIAKYASKTATTLAQAEKIMRDAFPSIKLTIPQDKIIVK